jgi:hypothetical protein
MQIRLILLFLIFSKALAAQINLQGEIKSNTGEALPNINVMIYNPGFESIIAYAVSNENGAFKTPVTAISDSLDIKVSSVQYRNETRRIANASQDLKFILFPEVMQLDAITVKAAPIGQKGDTIVYLVNSFAKQEDRSIEDVLRRMPGIEIEPGGGILYQGMPLQKFYVEGLDLMDGRYVVVSKNLPQTSVSAVEILENHQPVRILEERVASNQASLNIKLKHNITATGTAKSGAGLNPLLWELNVTPMIFMKKFQVLLSYQTNNTGDDVSGQLRVNTFQELIHKHDRPSEKPEIIDILTTNPPEIDEDRYLDNNIHLLNMNGLLRLNKDFQLRTNLYYINDFQQQQAGLARTHYTPTDTISYTEDYNNQLYDSYLYGEFTLSRNVKGNYLSNELNFQTRWDKQKSMILNDSQQIDQALDNPFSLISNDLRSINPVGNHLVEFKSYISYDQSQHKLFVSPGQFEQILNNGNPYEQMEQDVNLNRYYTNNSAGFVFGWKGLCFTHRAGFSFRQQTLESNLYTFLQNNKQDAGTDYINMLNGKHSSLYGQTGIEFIGRKINLKARLPLNWQLITMSDMVSNEKQNFNRILFDPGITLTYQINGFWKLRGAWSFVNRLGDLDRIHYGFILNNYRILSQNAAPISHTQKNNYSIYISFRNPIISFFNSLSYVYSTSLNNLIISSIIQSDGTSLLQAYESPNKAYYHSFQGQTSKFISKIKTTISLRATFNLRTGKSLMNAQLFDTKTVFYSLIPELNFSFTKWINAEYGLNAHFINTYIEDDEKSDISMLRHHVNIFAYPFKNQMISLSSEYYNHQQMNIFFIDFLYRYTFTKQKIDIEFRWNNIFNNKTYTTYQANTFTVSESTYILRPSQVLFSVKFSY